MTAATNIISKSTLLILVCALAFTTSATSNYDEYAEYDEIYNPYQFNKARKRDELANGQPMFLQQEDREAATFCQELQYSPDKAQKDYCGRNERAPVTFRGHQWRYMPNPLGEDESLYTADGDATSLDQTDENLMEQPGYLTRDQYGVWVNIENPLEMVLAFNGTMTGQWASSSYFKEDVKADFDFIAGCETNSRAVRALNTYIALATMFPKVTFTLTGHSLGGRLSIFVTEVIKKQCLTEGRKGIYLQGLPKKQITKSFAFNAHLFGCFPEYVVELARSSRVGEPCELRLVSNIGEFASRSMYETYGDLVCQVDFPVKYELCSSWKHYKSLCHAIQNITPEHYRGPWANGASTNSGYRMFYRGYRRAIELKDDSQDWIDRQDFIDAHQTPEDRPADWEPEQEQEPAQQEQEHEPEQEAEPEVEQEYYYVTEQGQYWPKQGYY